MHSLDLIVNPKVLKKKKKKKEDICILSFTLCAYLTKNEEFYLFIYEQSFTTNLIVAMTTFLFSFSFSSFSFFFFFFEKLDLQKPGNLFKRNLMNIKRN